MEHSSNHHGRVLLLLIPLTVLFTIQLTHAQQFPTVYFSRLTNTFDSQLPIGTPFVIKGQVPSNIVAVKVESFGFRGRVPDNVRSGYQSPFDTEIDSLRRLASAAALENIRELPGETIYLELGWEPTSEDQTEKPKAPRTDSSGQKEKADDQTRLQIPSAETKPADPPKPPAPSQVDVKQPSGGTTPQPKNDHEGASTRTFSITHPRLYFGRGYLFVFHYYSTAPENEIRKRIKLDIEQFLGRLDYSEMPEKTFWDKFKNVRFRDIVGSSSGKDVSLFDLLGSEQERSAFDRVVTFSGQQMHLRNFSRTCDAIGSSLNGLNNQNNAKELREGMSELKSVKNARDRSKILRDLFDYVVTIGRSCKSCPDSARFDSLRQMASKLSQDGNELKDNLGTLGSIADDIAKSVPVETINETWYESRPNLYSQTQREQYPFLVSLDAGMIYVFEFAQVLPTIGINFKFCPKDFDDPFDRSTELSMIVGLTMSGPTGLYPNYRGLLQGGSNKSLIVGFGVRCPSISSLLRLQGGVIFYRQEDLNPLVSRLQTKEGAFLGLSVNWDLVDFLNGLLTKINLKLF